MFYFRRAFCLTLWFFVLVLILLVGFELVNFFAAKSGFSSGELFVLEQGKGFLSGEIFGESFFADTSFLEETASVLKKAAVLLPPPIKFILRIYFSLF